MSQTLPIPQRPDIPRGQRLRIARESVDGRPTQAEFAKIIGVSRNTVSRYENDEPGTDKPIVLMRWADVTPYDIEWLSGSGDDDTPTTATYDAPLKLVA